MRSDGNQLRFYNPATGDKLLTLAESEDARREAEARAERAEAELERLRAELARLRGEVGKPN